MDISIHNNPYTHVGGKVACFFCDEKQMWRRAGARSLKFTTVPFMRMKTRSSSWPSSKPHKVYGRVKKDAAEDATRVPVLVRVLSYV